MFWVLIHVAVFNLKLLEADGQVFKHGRYYAGRGSDANVYYSMRRQLFVCFFKPKRFIHVYCAGIP